MTIKQLTRVRTTIQVLTDDEYNNEFKETVSKFLEEIKKKEEEQAEIKSPNSNNGNQVLTLDDNMEIVG